MKQPETTRTRPTAKEKWSDILKSIGLIALEGILCLIAIGCPISFPINIGRRVHNPDVASKVQAAAQQVLPQRTKTPDPITNPEPKTEPPKNLSRQDLDEQHLIDARALDIENNKKLRPVSPEEASEAAIAKFTSTVEELEKNDPPRVKKLFVEYLGRKGQLQHHTRRDFFYDQSYIMWDKKDAINRMYDLHDSIGKLSDVNIASLTPHIKRLSSLIKTEIDKLSDPVEQTRYRTEIQKKFERLGDKININ
jgi:hypothetical protein